MPAWLPSIITVMFPSPLGTEEQENKKATKRSTMPGPFYQLLTERINSGKDVDDQSETLLIFLHQSIRSSTIWRITERPARIGLFHVEDVCKNVPKNLLSRKLPNTSSSWSSNPDQWQSTAVGLLSQRSLLLLRAGNHSWGSRNHWLWPTKPLHVFLAKLMGRKMKTIYIIFRFKL